MQNNKNWWIKNVQMAQVFSRVGPMHCNYVSHFECLDWPYFNR